jgi:HSF-type DNA-binding
MAEHQSSNASAENGGNNTEGGSSSSTLVDYVDYADEVESISSNAGGEHQPPLLDSTEDAAGANGSAEQNFPVKLHYLLGDMEKDGLDHIVSWQTHGRSFTVHKPKDFAKLILPL